MKRAQLKFDDPEQSKRFIETAKKQSGDESGKEFVKELKKAKTNRPSQRRGA